MSKRTRRLADKRSLQVVAFATGVALSALIGFWIGLT